MVIQAFVDDSGGKGHTRHFVMACLIAEAEAWLDFSDEWSLCLKQPPALHGVFKMRDAARLTGAFRNWRADARDAKLRSLARIINRHAKNVTYSCIDLQAHADTFAKAPLSESRDPYFWPFQNTILATCFTLWDRGWRERFEIIFDENVIFGPRALLWYPAVCAIAQFREPEAATILPIDPLFRTDDEFMPIQAADLYAWCIRNGTDRPHDRSFEWLLGELRNVLESEYAQHYDRERMVNVLKQAHQLAREPPPGSEFLPALFEGIRRKPK